jgi:hypothetical protein
MALFVYVENYMLPCLNKQVWGVECPGCGIQRSISFLLEGNFMAAFEAYPAIYTLILFLGVVLLNGFYKIKYANTLIIGLAVTTVLLILINYILKFF